MSKGNQESVSANSPSRNPLSFPINFAWIVNPTLLVAATAWVFFDPVFSRLIAPDADRRPDEPRVLQVLWVLIPFATMAVVFCFLGLFGGEPRHRRLKNWLAFTALVAGWLALITSWQSLAWAGQRWRVGRHVDEIEKIAALLRTNWPTQDDDTPDLGPFSAYPQGHPGVLLLLNQPAPASHALPFNTIERTPDGGLAFQLTESETGAWLEWHPEAHDPANFNGGLETRYTVLRSSPLGNGWHLTQYKAQVLE